MHRRTCQLDAIRTWVGPPKLNDGAVQFTQFLNS